VSGETRDDRRAPAHLERFYDEKRRRTVERLREAIALLEAQGRTVSGGTVHAVSGLHYNTIARNPEARAVFIAHGGRARPGTVRVPTSDNGAEPIDRRSRQELVALLQEARAERDRAREAVGRADERCRALLARLQEVDARCARLEAERERYRALLSPLLDPDLVKGSGAGYAYQEDGVARRRK
jgi:hypothetical protein